MMRFLSLVLMFTVLLITPKSWGYTVEDHTYLKYKLNREAQSLSYDELRERFAEHPIYEPQCIPDDSRNTTRRNEAGMLQLFGPILNQGPESSALQISLIPLRYGFDLQAQIASNANQKNAVDSLYNFSSSIDCSNTVVDEEDIKNCDTLTFEHEHEFELPGVDQDNYFPSTTKSETWALHLLKDPKLIIAYITTDYSISLKSWLGQRKGTESYSKSIICLFHIVSSDQTDSSNTIKP